MEPTSSTSPARKQVGAVGAVSVVFLYIIWIVYVTTPIVYWLHPEVKGLYMCM